MAAARGTFLLVQQENRKNPRVDQASLRGSKSTKVLGCVDGRCYAA